MRQLELLIVQVLRIREEAPDGNMTWDELPAPAQAEAIEHLAKMLHASLEGSAAAEVRDE